MYIVCVASSCEARLGLEGCPFETNDRQLSVRTVPLALMYILKLDFEIIRISHFVRHQLISVDCCCLVVVSRAGKISQLDETYRADVPVSNNKSRYRYQLTGTTAVAHTPNLYLVEKVRGKRYAKRAGSSIINRNLVSSIGAVGFGWLATYR